MFIHRVALGVAAAVALTASGCATVVHGRYQQISITSDPAGATASLECAGIVPQSVVTPAKLRIRRGVDDCRVRVSHAGYLEQVVPLRRKTTPAFWVNGGIGLAVGAAAGTGAAINDFSCDNPDGCNSGSNGISLGGLAIGTGVPMLIDRATGAMWGYEPARVDVRLMAR